MKPPASIDEATRRNREALDRAKADPAGMVAALRALHRPGDPTHETTERTTETPEGTTKTERKATATPAWRLAGFISAFGTESPAAVVAFLADRRGGDGLSLLAWGVERVPREVAASKRPDPLFPGPAIMAPTGDRRAGTLYGLAAQRHPDNPTRWLPGFAPARESPALPLHLYDLGAGQQRGAGESYALRSFVWALLDTRPEDRNPDRPALLPPERLGDYVRRVYGVKHYRPARHGAAIARALDALESDEARVPFCRDGGWTARRVVSVADKPTRGASSDWIRLAVHLPPGSERGAIVDRERQKAAGLRSPTAFRLALSLAFAWAKPGALRQPVGKRGHWRQLRSAGRYPVLTDDRLMEFCYPTGTKHTTDLRRAVKALEHLERIGLVRRVAVGGVSRLMPGTDWAGWGEE